MQAELFSKFENQGYRQIACGCYSRIFAKDGSEWVIKKGNNDGTRTYLEWCLMKCNRGERMRGMPTLDFLVDLGYGQYMTAMLRYEPLGQRLINEFGFTRTYSVHTDEKCPKYIQELLDAFEMDCPGVRVSDMHYQNIMEDKRSGDFVITDPSACQYRPMGTLPSKFELQG